MPVDVVVTQRSIPAVLRASRSGYIHFLKFKKIDERSEAERRPPERMRGGSVYTNWTWIRGPHGLSMMKPSDIGIVRPGMSVQHIS